MSIFAGMGMRGGTRGGKDQFKWDDIRGDKDKEYYLGQSLKLQNTWWLDSDGKPKKESSLPQASTSGPSWARNKRGNKQPVGVAPTPQQMEELRRIKQQEEDLMLEALGLKPKTRRESGKALEKHEFKDLIKRGVTERDETDTNRVSGLGYAPTLTLQDDETAPPVSTSTTANEDGIELKRVVRGPQIPTEIAALRDRDNRDANPSDDDSKSRKKREKKEKKEKKHKKDKKDKKEKKHRREKRKERSDEDETHLGDTKEDYSSKLETKYQKHEENTENPSREAETRRSRDDHRDRDRGSSRHHDGDRNRDRDNYRSSDHNRRDRDRNYDSRRERDRSYRSRDDHRDD